MRRNYISLGIMAFIMTALLDNHMLITAPVLFLFFLIPPALILFYGLSAEDPPRAIPPPDPPYPPATPVPDPHPVPKNEFGALLSRASASDLSDPRPAPKNEIAAPLYRAPARDLQYQPPLTGTPYDPMAVAVVPPLPSFSVKPPGTVISDAFSYTKTATAGSIRRFVLLLLATLLFMVPLTGYLVRVLKGADPAPEVQGWGRMVADGLRVMLILVLYLIPTTFLLVILGRMNLLGVGAALLIAVMYLLPAGLLLFGRTGSVAAAFGIRPVIAAIGKIGWISYTGFFVLCFVLNIGINFVYLIPYGGPILMVALIAPLAVFEARYLALLSERGGSGDRAKATDRTEITFSPPV